MKMNLTAAAVRAASVGDLENFMVAATPGGIEAQEKAGQIEQSFAETLPVKGTSSEADRKQFEALGFVFKLDRTAAQNQGRDGIFVDCAFPKGWRKKPTDHSMWSDLLDDKGRKRGVIFYKAAFYDRSAHVGLCPRFDYGVQPDGGWQSESRQYAGYVKDEEKVIFTTELTTPEPKCDGRGEGRQAWLDWQEVKDAKGKEAESWLVAKYPDWRNPLAYWE